MPSTPLRWFQISLITLLAAASLPGHAADPVTGQQERAVTALEQDLKTDPNNAELWVHLGFAYRKLNKIDLAQSAFEKAASLSPNSKDAFFMLGLIYESKHMNAQATESWKKYMTLETDAAKRDMAEKHIHHLSQ